jgi:Xaa-Pro aminopeptidase
VSADQRPLRLDAVRELLARDGLDAMLVSHLPNIRYLTGFTGSSASLVISSRSVTLVTDFRYAAQAPAEVGNTAQVAIDRVNVWELLGRVLAAEAPRALGFEAAHVVVQDAERLSGLGGFRLVPLADTVERLRAAKSPAEVLAIRRAAELALAALADILAGVRPGLTELDVAAALESALRRRGSEWHPFPTIVAAGARSALPHARSTTRPIAEGELLLLDFGAQVDGYCADLTRVAVVGARADERQREVHGVVQAAQERAISQVTAGMTGRDADALARDVITARGFGELFGHSLGHGLGLEVHEGPRLSPTADSPLPLHAVVTIEPGVYLPGWGGIRLEDDIYLGPDGATCLSDNRTERLELV